MSRLGKSYNISYSMYVLFTQVAGAVRGHPFSSLVLNLSNEVIDFSSGGSIPSQTIVPKYRMDCSPYETVLTFGLQKVFSTFLSLLKVKRSQTISAPCLLMTLNNSIANSCIFRWWIVTALSFSNNSSKELV